MLSVRAKAQEAFVGVEQLQMPSDDSALLNQCALFDVHRLSRALTVLYNKHMRATGMSMAQFTLLRNIAALESVGVTQLAEAMLMDRTSVTRLVEPLIRDELIQVTVGEDRRFRHVAITRKGLAAVEKSEPSWREAQHELLDLIGSAQWRSTRGALRKTLKSVRSAKISSD